MLNIRQMFGSKTAIYAKIIEGATGTNGADSVSGDPVMCAGNIPGTAVDTASSGLGRVLIEPHIVEHVVAGVKSGGNSAIAAGDLVYMKTDGLLNGDSGGTLYGVAYGNSLDPAVNPLGTNTITGNLVASAATTTKIRILVGF